MKKYTYKNYTEYMKDNPKGYWFKNKLYGFGWTPIKWQGWLVVLVFTALVIADFLYTDSTSQSASDTLRPFFIKIIILICILIFICYKK